jgi:hypothetical protein
MLPGPQSKFNASGSIVPDLWDSVIFLVVVGEGEGGGGRDMSVMATCRRIQCIYISIYIKLKMLVIFIVIFLFFLLWLLTRSLPPLKKKKVLIFIIIICRLQAGPTCISLNVSFFPCFRSDSVGYRIQRYLAIRMCLQRRKRKMQACCCSHSLQIRQIPLQLQGNHSGGESYQMLPKKNMGKGSGSSLFPGKVISLQKCKKHFSVFSVYGETNR